MFNRIEGLNDAPYTTKSKRGALHLVTPHNAETKENKTASVSPDIGWICRTYLGNTIWTDISVSPRGGIRLAKISTPWDEYRANLQVK